MTAGGGEDGRGQGGLRLVTTAPGYAMFINTNQPQSWRGGVGTK